MKTMLLSGAVAIAGLSTQVPVSVPDSSRGSDLSAPDPKLKAYMPSNPLIDYSGFEKIVLATEKQRATHRLSEFDFMVATQESGVVVLDARSASMYALRHIKGAVNLPFTDFTADSLSRVIPAKDSKVLIYCNNNFLGSPIAFASKTATASLNLSTYTSLISYGYTNVYELGPLLDVKSTVLPFEGTEVK